MLQNKIKKRLTPTIEDCLIVIKSIEKRKGVVRVSGISRCLGVSLPFVSTIAKKMKIMGLVEHESYSYVRLTPLGKKLAGQVFEKRRVITHFLHSILGMDAEEVDREACELEHSLSSEVEKRLRRLTEFITLSPEISSNWAGESQRFLNSSIEKG